MYVDRKIITEKRDGHPTQLNAKLYRKEPAVGTIIGVLVVVILVVVLIRIL